MKPYHFSFSALSSPMKGRKILYSMARSLRPSVLEGADGSSPPQKTGSRSKIEALDGLRGLACLIVFNEHFTYNFTFMFIFGYGNYGRYTFLQMPFVKIFWSGTPMVSVFYMISGYVLSYKALKQIRSKQLHNFQATITSSVVRRGFRLYPPAIIAILMCGALVRLGLFDYSWYLWNKDNNYLHLHERPPPIAANITTQAYSVSHAAFRMLDLWDWKNKMDAGDYDLHTWTIAVEFRASMILYLGLIATSTFRQSFRLCTNLFVMGLCICTDRCDVMLFFAGMLAAEVDMILKPDVQEEIVKPLDTRRCSPSNKMAYAWLLLFVLGIYLLCTPLQGGPQTIGYMTILKLVPSTILNRPTLPLAVGAILTVWSSVNCSFLQPLFTNSFSLYFGKISFALYLVHGNVLKSLGYAVMPIIYRMTSPTGTMEGLDRMGLFISWILAALVVWPVTLWLSDLFCSVVDDRCVRFARWIEGKARVKDL